MIDYHCHLLPAFDDGARDLTDSLAMARILAAHGFRQVCCTPHQIRGVWDMPDEAVRRATAELQQRLNEEGISLSLVAGREYYLDEFLLQNLADPLLLPGNRLLVELPTRCSEEQAREILYQIVRCGIIPLIAHPERNALLQPTGEQKSLAKRIFTALFNASPTTHRPSLSTQHSSPSTQHSKIHPSHDLIPYLQDLGCLFQGNLGSFSGVYGRQVAARARLMLAQGLYTCLGTDGHHPDPLRSVLAASSSAEPGVREILERDKVKAGAGAER